MKKSKNRLIITFMLLLFVVPLSTPSGLVLDVPHPSSAFPNVVGSAASEEDNIDSFDVHPANRWTEDLDGVTPIISDGMYNVSDIGDNSFDNSIITRDLRDLDGNIEIRFKIDSNASSVASAFDGIFILVEDSAGTNDIIFTAGVALDDDFYITKLQMFDVDGNLDSKTLVNGESYFDNTWVILRLDYDILKSEFRFRLFHDNGSKIFDYDIFEISSDRAGLFDASSLQLKIWSAIKSTANDLEILTDYAKAPFKEREWEQTTAHSDSDWLSVSWQGVHFQDDISAEDATFSLTVPFLDAVSGSFNSELEDGAQLAINDDIGMFFTLSGVDADDGDLHTIVRISTGYQAEDANPDSPKWSVTDGDSVTIVSDQGVGSVPGNTKNPHIDFVLSIDNDRSIVTIRGNGWLDHEDDTTKQEFVAVLSVSDFVDSPSQEFVLSINYHIGAFIGNTEATMRLTNINIIERDIFADIGGLIDDVIGGAQDLVGGGTDIFTAIFRWIVSVITDFLGVMLDLLLGGLTALGSLLDSVISTLGSVITELQGLADDIATAIWSGIETTLDFLFDAIDGIWTALIAILDDIIAQLILLASDVADFVFAAIEVLVVLLLDIVEELWAIAEGLVFFIWDAIGLPDVLEIADLLLSTIFDVITATPDIIFDIMSWVELLASFILIIWWSWALFLSFAENNFNPFEGMGLFIEKCFTNLLPFSLLGFEIYVPQALAVIPLTIFLIFADSGFNIW